MLFVESGLFSAGFSIILTSKYSQNHSGVYKVTPAKKPKFIEKSFSFSKWTLWTYEPYAILSIPIINFQYQEGKKPCIIPPSDPSFM